MLFSSECVFFSFDGRGGGEKRERSPGLVWWRFAVGERECLSVGNAAARRENVQNAGREQLPKRRCMERGPGGDLLGGLWRNAIGAGHALWCALCALYERYPIFRVHRYLNGTIGAHVPTFKGVQFSPGLVDLADAAKLLDHYVVARGAFDFVAAFGLDNVRVCGSGTGTSDYG